MQFFVPGITDRQEAEAFYLILRRLAVEAHGRMTERRIRSLSFTQRGALRTISVGETDPATGEPCVAIFEGAGSPLYFVYVEGPIRGNGKLVTSPYLVEVFAT
ncbi:hypothetical protein ACO2Q3_12205 [Caulobacter sp. KR2-114]|uniref:hypothetical protein n=1 Tax=Caulobacter sp. KR2-114 TaxID=3400912 RepID=UPI003C1151D4